jgi:hypothetical protein
MSHPDLSRMLREATADRRAVIRAARRDAAAQLLRGRLSTQARTDLTHAHTTLVRPLAAISTAGALTLTASPAHATKPDATNVMDSTSTAATTLAQSDASSDPVSGAAAGSPQQSAGAATGDGATPPLSGDLEAAPDTAGAEDGATGGSQQPPDPAGQPGEPGGDTPDGEPQAEADAATDTADTSDVGTDGDPAPGTVEPSPADSAAETGGPPDAADLPDAAGPPAGALVPDGAGLPDGIEMPEQLGAPALGDVGEPSIDVASPIAAATGQPVDAAADAVTDTVPVSTPPAPEAPAAPDVPPAPVAPPTPVAPVAPPAQVAPPAPLAPPTAPRPPRPAQAPMPAAPAAVAAPPIHAPAGPAVVPTDVGLTLGSGGLESAGAAGLLLPTDLLGEWTASHAVPADPLVWLAAAQAEVIRVDHAELERAPVAAAPTVGRRYEVVLGDSLWSISRQLWTGFAVTDELVGATVAVLHAANVEGLGGDPDVLPAGYVLSIPTGTPG